MSKYLITGGAGFIGSNIARRLLEKGESVRILDDLSSGKLDNINDFLDKIEFIEGTFTDIGTARKAVKNIDFVLHHGAVASVVRSIEDPIITNDVNILGTLNMLVAAKDAGVKRFIFATSAAVYGNSPIMPKEESMKNEPLSPYALQKLAGEEYCKNFYNLYGLETVCLRYFNVFGPNQDPNSLYSAVIPLFIQKMIKGERPIIYGDGNTSRDFTFVDNNVDANIKACTASLECVGQSINIATGVEISLNDLVEKINKILGTEIKPIYEDERKGDIKYSSADISKAQKLLNYEVLINFDEGLEKTINYYKNILK